MKRRRKAQNKISVWLKVSMLIFISAIGYVIGGSAFNPIPKIEAQTSTQEVDPESHFVTFEQDVKPLMEHYCYDCHGEGSDKGDLDMDQYTSFASMIQDRETWGKIKNHLDLKLMPPLDEDQPQQQEAKLISQWIENTIFHTDSENPDPGSVVIRRLNRNEYRNTIYDLLGVEVEVETILPLDDTGYGFDTISDVHTVSSAHIEKYLSAAESALNKATIIGDMPWNKQTFKLDELIYEPKRITKGHFYVNGSAQLPKETLQGLTKGTYILEIEASSTPAGDEHAILEIRLADRSIAKFTIPPGESNRLCKVTLPLDKKSNLTINYTNDLYDPDHPDNSKRDRNLKVHMVSLTGPTDLGRPEKPATHRALFPQRTVSQTPEMYAQEVWLNFARRAFRREVSIQEIESYNQFIDPKVETEKDLEEQISLGIQAMLISPHFLYLNSDPLINEDIKNGKTLITEYALASRLSYFLWSSAPDSTLLEKAKSNQLRENLSAEINRMLDDPKAVRFIENFGGQWLQLRDLDVHSPNSKLYPQWSKSLRLDAIKETNLFLENLINNDLSALDCLDSDYTYLNENLANFYDIENVEGNHFRKVTLSPQQRKQRGGLLGQASILTLTSYPDRTSPVLRGKWVLDNIIGSPTPPPPQDIPALETKKSKKKHVSLREQLEAHREKAECATCHKLLDPLGFALQNFSGIGKWRTRSNGKVIDTTGKLVSGEDIQDGAELRSVLRSNKSEEFMRCLTEKLLIYSIGRGVEYYDKPAIDLIMDESRNNNHSFRTLIHSVCNSIPFQMTRTKHFKSK